MNAHRLREGNSRACRQVPRSRRLTTELGFQLCFAFVQRLQAQLPAMQLNGELIDVAGDFGALRFVLFQFPLHVFRNCRRRCFCSWHRCRLRATLTRHRHSGRSAIHHQRTRAMLTGKYDIGGGCGNGGARWLHHQQLSKRYTANDGLRRDVLRVAAAPKRGWRLWPTRDFANSSRV